MSVRVAQPADLMTVFQFRKSLCEEERGSAMMEHEIVELMHEVSGSLMGGGPTILLAEYDDDPVGSVWCYGKAMIGPNDGRTMRVDMLYIIPSARKHGHLKDLWDKVHQIADEYGIDRMQGFVKADNKFVQRMWKKRGAYVAGYILEKRHGIESKHSTEGLQSVATESSVDSRSDCTADA